MPICPNGHSSQSDDYCDTCGSRIGGAVAAPSQGGQPSFPSAPLPPPANAPTGDPCPDCGTPRSDRFCEECGYDFANPMPGPYHGLTGYQPGPPPPQNQTQYPSPNPPGPQTQYPGPNQVGLSSQVGGLPGPPPPQNQTQYPGPVQSGGWYATVMADRAYYEAVLAQEGPDANAIAFPPYCPERQVPLNGPAVRVGRRSQSRGVPEIDLSEAPGDPGVSRTHAVLMAQPDGGWSLVDPGSANGTTLNGATEPVAVNVEIPLKDGDRIHVGAWTTITIRRG